jgi:hypothetical protein
MKAFEKSTYKNLGVAEKFNAIILNKIQGYDGKKKEQLKAFLEDMQKGGCQSGIIEEFIYHEDCKKFYIENIDELEEIKEDLEEILGECIKNSEKLPYYTFMCWLCFEEYCYNLLNNVFES